MFDNIINNAKGSLDMVIMFFVAGIVANVLSTLVAQGTFDPMTLGHLDLVERASSIFDHLIVAVARHPHKNTLFDATTRLEMVRESVDTLNNVEAECFEGLLVDFAKQKSCLVLIRGLRAYSDFEYEFQMALMNRKLAPEIETMFLMPKESYSYLSSNMIGEIAQLNGDIGPFVPAAVEERMKNRFNKKRAT